MGSRGKDGSWLVRMEGVNTAQTWGDSEDLSTIRGGSMMLLDAVGHFGTALGGTPITTGASAGLFHLDADAMDLPHMLGAALRQGCQDGELLSARWATTMVAAVPDPESCAPATARESALAAIRCRQMQAPTLVIDEPADAVCTVSGFRSAPSHANGHAAYSVTDRRQYGVDRKQQAFYQAVLQPEYDLNTLLGPCAPVAERRMFSNDFQELARRPGLPLDGKMAVIYMDGNRFGDIQRRVVDDPEGEGSAADRQRQFDDRVKGLRRDLLWAVLGAVVSGGTPTESQRVRLETLLWGGDEIIWVVPAWLGWKVLGIIAETTRNWAINGHHLFHAVGVVFCAMNAPINRVTALARDLADLAKEVDRGRSLLAWQVLESFDHVGRDLGGHLDIHAFPGACRYLHVVDLDCTTAGLVPAETLKGGHGLPRRRLRRFTDSLYHEVTDRMSAEKRLFLGLPPGIVDGLRQWGECLADPPLRQAVRAAAERLGDDNPRIRQPGDADFQAMGRVLLETVWDYVLPDLLRVDGED